MAATDQGMPIAAVHNKSTPGMMKELLDRMKRLGTELLNPSSKVEKTKGLLALTRL